MWKNKNLDNVHWIENGYQKDSCLQQLIEFIQNRIIKEQVEAEINLGDKKVLRIDEIWAYN